MTAKEVQSWYTMNARKKKKEREKKKQRYRLLYVRDLSSLLLLIFACKCRHTEIARNNLVKATYLGREILREEDEEEEEAREREKAGFVRCNRLSTWTVEAQEGSLHLQGWIIDDQTNGQRNRVSEREEVSEKERTSLPLIGSQCDESTDRETVSCLLIVSCSDTSECGIDDIVHSTSVYQQRTQTRQHKHTHTHQASGEW